mgnify:FL=1
MEIQSVARCGPFVSMADVLGIVGFATWCGTGRLVEPKYHGDAKYHPSRGTFRCLERVRILSSAASTVFAVVASWDRPRLIGGGQPVAVPGAAW